MKSTLSLAMLPLLLCASARAQETHSIDQRDIEVGDAVACDTQEQIQRYIARYSGDQAEAIRAVNREEKDPEACGVISGAYVRGPHIATTSHGNSSFEIVRILVLDVDDSDGLRPVKPVPYFTVFEVTEYPV